MSVHRQILVSLVRSILPAVLDICNTVSPSCTAPIYHYIIPHTATPKYLHSASISASDLSLRFHRSPCHYRPAVHFLNAPYISHPNTVGHSSFVVSSMVPFKILEGNAWALVASSTITNKRTTNSLPSIGWLFLYPFLYELMAT